VYEDLLPFSQAGSIGNACHAVSPTKGIEAASSMVRFFGFSAMSASFMEIDSAKVPMWPSRGRA
jgi:hypothetical protein